MKQFDPTSYKYLKKVKEDGGDIRAVSKDTPLTEEMQQKKRTVIRRTSLAFRDIVGDSLAAMNQFRNDMDTKIKPLISMNYQSELTDSSDEEDDNVKKKGGIEQDISHYVS